MSIDAKLLKKILSAQKELKPILETGKNKFQNYNYATAKDVIEPVKKTCNEQGLVMFIDVPESSITRGSATCLLKLTIADSETGESLTITSHGYAEDWSYKENKANGDKAIYKAITGATKYAIRQLFVLPSTDDPENYNEPQNNYNNHRQSTKYPRKDQRISQSQVTALHNIKDRVGLTKEEAKAIIENFGYSSSHDILLKDYNKIAQALQESKVKCQESKVVV